MRVILSACLSLCLSSNVLAQEAPSGPPAPADWGQALREDAQSFHDAILKSHPGPVDPENPAFVRTLEDGLALAFRRAETADSRADWMFALQAYQASFDDGHLSLHSYELMGATEVVEWPGFMTVLRDDGRRERHEVVVSEDPAAPPSGAVLIGCGDQSAAAMAAERLGQFRGRWSLKSQRFAWSPALFVDQSNPYVGKPARCTFSVGGDERAYDLTWRAVSPNRVDALIRDATADYSAPIGLRHAAGGVWIEMGSFSGSPTSESGQKLAALLTEIESRVDEIRAAPVLVFDLRGNTGGSSSWSSRIASRLWGEDRVEAFGPHSAGVDWRASDLNLTVLKQYRDVTFAQDARRQAYFQRLIDGMTEAQAQGRPLWREAIGPRGPVPAGMSPMQGRVFVLTDHVCASACLDAVDVFTAMGAIPVGQETSADSVYIDVFGQQLEGLRVTAVIPMKVWRGRPRGNNQPVAPVHVWTGRMDDTAGLEAWIADLAKRP